MKTVSVILIALTSITQTVYADDVVYLNKGVVTPYDGYLFTPAKEKELHLLDENLSYYKSLSESLSVINKAQDDNLNKMQERINIRDTQIDLMSNRLNEVNSGWFSKASYFIFGALVTGLLAQAIYRTK